MYNADAALAFLYCIKQNNLCLYGRSVTTLLHYYDL